MFKRIITSTAIATICVSCGDVKKEHQHGENCDHSAEPRYTQHKHSESCNHEHGEDTQKHNGHEHGKNCSHEQNDAAHEHGENCSHSKTPEQRFYNCEGEEIPAPVEDEDDHDHSIAAAKSLGTVNVQNIDCKVSRSCVASFYLIPAKPLAKDTVVRATIVNGKGEESLKSKAAFEDGHFSINVEEAPELDAKSKLVIDVESNDKEETVEALIK